LSSISGIGAKATTSGITVGIALENFKAGQTQNPDGTITYNSESSTGKILVFVNLGYAKIDPQIAGGQIQAASASSSAAFWNIDAASGRIKPIAVLDLNNFEIMNVKSISSANGTWNIDESGKLIAREINAEKVVAKKAVFDIIEMKDEDTGEIYCMKIKSGVVMAAAGGCQAVSSESSGQTQGEQLIQSTSSSPSLIVVSDSTASTSTASTSTASTTVSATASTDSVSTGSAEPDIQTEPPAEIPTQVEIPIQTEVPAQVETPVQAEVSVISPESETASQL